MQGKGPILLAPSRILPDSPTVLLGDLRLAISLRPELAHHPRRLAEYLKVRELEVRMCLEALRVEGEVLP
jgi:hypothetical protein